MRHWLVASLALTGVPALAQETAPAPVPVPAPVPDETLQVGDPAPALEHVEWIRGEPVEEFEEGAIYVLDFWATWCIPCRAAIPHLDALQRTHEDDNVRVVGVAVWEREEGAVAGFVAQRSEQMNYRIAEDIDQKTADAYLTASGANAIPTVYVVDGEGTLAWIWDASMPLEAIDEVVGLLVDGEFTREKAKAAVDELLRVEREKRRRIPEVDTNFRKAFNAGEWEKAEELLGELFEIQPMFVQTNYPQFMYVAKVKQGKLEEANTFARHLIGTDLEHEPDLYSEFAWTIVVPGGPLAEEERDVGFAISIAEQAASETERSNADILDTLARAYFVDGRVEDAIRVQREAVELAGEDRRFYESALREYEAAFPDDE